MKKGIRQVAILVGTSGEWERGIVEGIVSYMKETGPWYLRVKPGTPDSYDEIPTDWEGDGIIAHVSSPLLAEQLNTSGLPVVNIADSSLDDFDAPSFRTDDSAGVRLAIEHFRERGFRNLAYAGPNSIANALEYRNFFHEQVEALGFHGEVFNFDHEHSDLLGRLEQWLSELPKPVGLLVWGHGYAQQAVDSCLQLDIAVPHDIAILSGCNEELLSDVCYPPLSGIVLPTKQIGYHAAQSLDLMMQGKTVPKTVQQFAPREIKARLSTDTLAVEDEQMRKVMEFIQDHAFEPIRVEDILSVVPMGRSTLDRKFLQVFGRTPPYEIRRLRIQRAKQLLASSDLSMQLIAEKCGYVSYNYLSFAFKRDCGISPQHYRKQIHGRV